MFGSSRCGVCGNALKRSKASWKLHGKKTVVCSRCNSKLETRMSAAAFGKDVDIPIPRKESSGCLKLVGVLIVISVIAALFAPKSEDDAQGDSKPLAPVDLPVSDTPAPEKETKLKPLKKLSLDEIKEFRILYDELQEFKSDPKFHEMGFSLAGLYNAWLKRVHKFGDKNNSVHSRDLINMAIVYMKGGKETEFTLNRIKEFDALFKPLYLSERKVWVEPMKVLYAELLGFKDDNDYHLAGYGLKKYYDWKLKVKALKVREKLAVDLKKNLFVLAKEYEKNKGKESDKSKAINRKFEDFF